MTEPELVTYPGFTAYGLSAKTTGDVESNVALAKLPSIWRRFYNEAVPARLGANFANGRVVAVFNGYEFGIKTQFTVTAGVQIRVETGCPEDLSVTTVLPGEYLRFSAHGYGLPVVAQLWREITEFFARSEHPLAGSYDRAYTADFERYGDPELVSVFISVKRKLGVQSMPR